MSISERVGRSFRPSRSLVWMNIMARAHTLCILAGLLIALLGSDGKIVQIARETPKTLTPARLRGYIERDEPFVYADPASATWRSVRMWNNTDYLADRFHFSEMPGFVWGENESVWDHPSRYDVPGWSGRDAARSWSTADRMHRPLARYFDTYEEGPGGKAILSANLKCLGPELLADFPLPWPLAGASRRMMGAGIWPSLYVYPAGSALRMHVDTGSKFQYWTTLHTGSKHVRIISFSDWSEHLRKYFSPATGGGEQPGLDVFKMDLESNPELADVTVYDAVVHAGEEWYTPTAAAHAMIHLESPTINTVVKWMDEAHRAPVARLCDKLARGIVRSSKREARWPNFVEPVCHMYNMTDPTVPAQHDPEMVRGKTFWEAFASPDFCHDVARGCETPKSICAEAIGPTHIHYCHTHGEKQCAEIRRACLKTQETCHSAMLEQHNLGARSDAAMPAAAMPGSCAPSTLTDIVREIKHMLKNGKLKLSQLVAQLGM